MGKRKRKGIPFQTPTPFARMLHLWGQAFPHAHSLYVCSCPHVWLPSPAEAHSVSVQHCLSGMLNMLPYVLVQLGCRLLIPHMCAFTCAPNGPPSPHYGSGFFPLGRASPWPWDLDVPLVWTKAWSTSFYVNLQAHGFLLGLLAHLLNLSWAFLCGQSRLGKYLEVTLLSCLR